MATHRKTPRPNQAGNPAHEEIGRFLSGAKRDARMERSRRTANKSKQQKRDQGKKK